MCRAEQGRMGRKRDCGEEGLRARQRHRVSMLGAGLEDTPRDEAIKGHPEELGFGPSPWLMTPPCTRRVCACLPDGLNPQHHACSWWDLGKSWEENTWCNRFS